MGLRKISTIDEANRFLQQHYLPKHNMKFARKASKEGDMHRSKA